MKIKFSHKLLVYIPNTKFYQNLFKGLDMEHKNGQTWPASLSSYLMKLVQRMHKNGLHGQKMRKSIP
jgi:hypothetical protein